MDGVKEFIDFFSRSIEEDTFVRLTLSKQVDKSLTLKKVIIKLVIIKKKLKFSIVYRHDTKDVTKNYELIDGKQLIEGLVVNDFLIASLFTIKQDFVYDVENHQLRKKPASFKTLPQRTHDKQKIRLIKNNKFLVELGVLDPSGRVKKDKGDKYKQINKFIEIVDSLIKKTSAVDQLKEINIHDMGSGKGYLTFALYDYLSNYRKIKTTIKGIEIREDLVTLCNKIAKKVEFNNLSFEKGFIQDYNLVDTDILIALHACDTATDDAIFKGIQVKAKLIICAPCCHKQIRKEMHCSSPLTNITNHGILKERQAEIVTDTIRALLLELAGYKAQVFEFISTEHTGKNLMIVGQKHNNEINSDHLLNEIKQLKAAFGIEYHYLERLLSIE